MKLILIYGSPAVGKLTTANEIAKLTGFKVFHNHLTIDAVKPVFEFGSKSFWKLVHLFRIETVPAPLPLMVVLLIRVVPPVDCNAP